MGSWELCPGSGGKPEVKPHDRAKLQWIVCPECGTESATVGGADGVLIAHNRMVHARYAATEEGHQ